MVTPGAAAVLQSTPEGVEFTYRSLLNAVVFLGVAYVARVVDLLLNRVADRLVQHRCRVALLIPVAKFRIYGAAVYVVVEVLFDLNQTQLIAFAGFSAPRSASG